MTETVIDVEGPELSVADLTPARVDHGALITPAADKADIVEAFRQYTELVDALVDKREDYQHIQGKAFMKKAGFRKLAVAFGVSFSIDRWTHDRDEQGRIIRSEFLVTATAPNGRSNDGYGACSVWDRCTSKCKGRAGGCDGFNHFSKPEHDVPATAETRAKNRAASDLFAMGQVSAEEVDTADPASRWANRDQIKLIIAAAKSLKANGGAPGSWPVVLGVPVVEVVDDINENGDPVKLSRTLITEAQADDLLSALEREQGGIENAGGAASEQVSAPVGPAADLGGEAPVVSDPPPAPPEPKVPLASAPGELALANLPVGDGVTEPTGEGGTGDPEPTSGVTAPSPGDVAEVPLASGGEKSRFAQLVKKVYPDGDEGILARHALCAVVSDGRTRSSKELYQPEILAGIKAAKLLQSGNLVFGVTHNDGTVDTLPPGDVPTDEEQATIVVAYPVGVEAPGPGDAFFDELLAMMSGS